MMIFNCCGFHAYTHTQWDFISTESLVHWLWFF